MQLRASLVLFLVCAGAVAPEPVRATPAADIWIALRHDNKNGTGSKNDPFDGSSAEKLDAILRRALDVPNMHVHFGPGTFYTRSVLADDPVMIRKPGITVSGAGMYRTTLALDPAIGPKLPPWAFSVLQADQFIAQDSHLTVRDITCDANYHNLINARGDIAIGNVSLTGSYCSLIRVRGIHAHGDHASQRECFALNIGCGGNYDIHDALIAGCVVEAPRGNYINGININGWPFDGYPATSASGVVRGCKVSDLRADGRHMAAYWITGGTIKNSSAQNCTIGVYMEYARDLTVTNCDFRNNTWRGVWVSPGNDYGGIQNLKVLNNTIEVSNYLDGAAAIEVGSGNARNATQDVLLSGNTLLRKNARPVNKAFSISTSPTVPGLVLLGNRIDRRLDHSHVRSANLIDNRSLGGSRLPALPDVLLQDGAARFLHSPQVKPTPNAPR